MKTLFNPAFAIFLITFLIIMLYAAWKYWKSPRQRFEDKLTKIRKQIKESEITQRNFDKIDKKFCNFYIDFEPSRLQQNRVKKLFADFLFKFDEFNRYKI